MKDLLDALVTGVLWFAIAVGFLAVAVAFIWLSFVPIALWGPNLGAAISIGGDGLLACIFVAWIRLKSGAQRRFIRW